MTLSADAAKRVERSEKMYWSDWSSLEGALTSILLEAGSSWNGEFAQQATALLARMFVNEQMSALKSAGVEFSRSAWSGNLGDPRQKLRDLLYNCGVASLNISSVLSKFVDVAKSRPVINKLTRTAVFAALEGRDPLQNSAALHANSWEEVNLLLDSSVAIPLLCARRTEPVDKYIYAVSSRAIDVLMDLGVSCYIAPEHLKECASHLLRALRYQPLEERTQFASALRFSENAFVAYYYSLRVEGRRSPPTLNAFLRSFSRVAPYAARSSAHWNENVTSASSR